MTPVLAIFVVVAALGCSASTRVHAEDPEKSYAFVVNRIWDKRARGGWPGALHPAVIEYVFGSEDAPWAAFYARADLARADTEAAARALAGAGKPTGHHYARARARLLAPHINTALATRPDPEEGVAVELICCATLDPDGTLRPGTISVDLAISQRSQSVRMTWGDARTFRLLSWDLAHVPHAFHPEAQLDHATVASTIRPLHPPQARDE